MAMDAVLTCCRDEEDAIATFVLFYLDLGFDAVHVVDNGSVDQTADIVRELIAAGLPVTLQHDGRLGYERHLTEWFHAAGRRLNPRWLFFLDCDEFILLPRSARDWLDAFPPDVNRLSVRQREIYPAPEGSEPSHFLLSRRSEPGFNDTTKDMVRFHPDARVYGGKHRVDIPDARALCPTEVFIRHYKYRSVVQARRKEQNRVAAKRVYSDADLAQISVTGIGPAREWIEHCERATAEELWRDSFNPLESMEDGAMADWAVGFLQRMGRRAPRLSEERCGTAIPSKQGPHIKDSIWRQRGERVLLRPVPPLLRARGELAERCPWYFIGASGARLRALNGRDYLDLEMGRGPNILGYGHPVTDAAREAFAPATARTALYHPVEVELAEIIVDQVPCAESVLFAKNGSDACTAAVRVARTVTNRRIIVSIGYHGFGDWCVADDPTVAGFPDGFKGHVVSLALNDCEALAAAFERHSGNVAGLIVEPAHRLLPDPQFLGACRALADAHGAVLIFDEVVTAFRLDLGGAQSRYGVVPDLACLGKAMANGLPISALVGRRDLMQALERSFFSMTFMHDNPTFATAKACLTHLVQTGGLGPIARTGESLRRAFEDAARRHGLGARALGFAARLDLDFPVVGQLDDAEQLAIFGAALFEHGILPTASIFACEMMTERDIAEAGAAFEEGMARIREHIDRRG